MSLHKLYVDELEIGKTDLDIVNLDVNFYSMRTIKFYRTDSGNSPIEEFLDSLTGKQAQKITWVLQLIEQHPTIPRTYFKKLVNTEDIWEVRVRVGNNNFRLLGFYHEESLVVLTNGFQKKTQKTPSAQIKLAEQRKRKYLSRSRA